MDNPTEIHNLNSTTTQYTKNNKEFDIVAFMKNFDFSIKPHSSRRATLLDFNICGKTNQNDNSEQIIFKRQENYGERKRIKP